MPAVPPRSGMQTHNKKEKLHKDLPQVTGLAEMTGKKPQKKHARKRRVFFIAWKERSFVPEDEARHVGARIVAAHIVLHAAGGHLLHIQLGVEDAFLIPECLRHGVARGIDDRAAPAADHVGQAGHLRGAAEILRVVLPGEDHVAVHEVAVPLDGDVADGVLPFRIVIRIGGDVDRHALLVERRPGEGHIALPADHASHGAPGRVHHGEEIPIRVAPHHALASRGLQLPVVHHRALGRNENVGIVQRGRHGVPLGDAHGEIDAVPLRRLGEGVRFRAGDENGRVVIALPVPAALLGAAPHGEAEGHAVGIARDEKLRKDDELSAVGGGFVDEAERLGEAGVLVEEHRRSLDDRDAAGGLQCFHDRVLSLGNQGIYLIIPQRRLPAYAVGNFKIYL